MVFDVALSYVRLDFLLVPRLVRGSWRVFSNITSSEEVLKEQWQLGYHQQSTLFPEEEKGWCFLLPKKRLLCLRAYFRPCFF